jgi:hypothetical protein
MKGLERLIRDMRKMLLPYHHEHDIESGARRWQVDQDECIASWIAQQLRVCREKNRCFRRERCVFYEYGDIARKNYEICYEVLLLLENGEITCSEGESAEEKDKT